MVDRSSGFTGVRWSRRLSGGRCWAFRSCGGEADGVKEGLHGEERDGDVAEFPYGDEDAGGTCRSMSW